MIEEAGAGMVMFVGVQSNQFPHTLDLAKPLLERGVQVAIGGFHVSGTMSMLGGNDADVHRAKAMGISLFAGEAEGRLEQVLQDAYAKKLKPLYNYMADLPGIEGAPIPLISSVRASSAPQDRRNQLSTRGAAAIPVFLLHHHQRPGT